MKSPSESSVAASTVVSDAGSGRGGRLSRSMLNVNGAD